MIGIGIGIGRKRKSSYWTQPYFKDGETFDNGKLVLQFDDGYSDNYRFGLPLFTEKGIKITIWGDCSFLGGDGGVNNGLSWDQCRDLVAQGHDLQCHSFNGITGSDASIVTDLELVNTTFANNGLPVPKHHAYPGVNFDDRITDVIDNLRFTARTVDNIGVITRKSSFYKMPCLGITETQATIYAAMDYAKANKTALGLFGHRIGEGASLTISVALLETYIDYAQSIGLDFITASELYDKMFYIDLRLSRSSEINSDEILVVCKNRLNSIKDSISIERSEDDGINYSEIHVLAPGETDYLDTGLTAGKNYYYRARGFRGTRYLPYSRIEFTSTPITLTVTSTGDGTGVATLTYTALEALYATLDGNGKFYTNSACTEGETQSLFSYPVKSTTVYIKVTSGVSNLILYKNLSITINAWTAGTNAPSLGGEITELSKITNLNCQGNNTLSGVITKFYDLEQFHVMGSVTITGDITLLTKLNYLSSTCTLTGDITNLTLLTTLWNTLTSWVFTGDITNLTNLVSVNLKSTDNALTGSINGLTSLTWFYVLGNTNVFTGDLGLIVANLQYLRLGGSHRIEQYTEGANWSALIDESYVVIPNNTGYGFTAAKVDAIINEINSTRTAGRKIYISITGKEGRTHASDVAKAAIIAASGSVSTSPPSGSLYDSDTFAAWEPLEANGAVRDGGGVETVYWDLMAGSAGREAEQNSGTCTIYGVYEITATEVDHFFAGCEVGNIFSSAGTETLDANNKVKRVTGNHLSQPISTKRPVNGIFDGSDDFMKMIANAGITQPFRVILVLKQITWTNWDVIFDGNTANRCRVDDQTASPKIIMNAGASLSANSDLTLNTYVILDCLFNGFNSKIRVNENPAIEGNASTNIPGGFTLFSSGFAGGGNMARAGFKAGFIRIWDSSTNETDAATIRAALGAKYGVAGY
jgi:peptidoglycan/xylan/chitin deacetylase (PgdA/CDA1 family)